MTEVTNRVAILEIQQGSLAEGFQVALEIRDERGLPTAKLGGRLPGRAELEGLYECWQHSFREAIALSARRGDDDWLIDESLPTHRSTSEGVEACRRCARELEADLQAWLRPSAEEGWVRIRERLREEFARSGKAVRLAILARDLRLWKLPWHTWDLLEAYPEIGVGYGFPEFEQPKILPVPPPRNRVRILGVLGDSRHLDLTADRGAIAALGEAEPLFLEQPTAQKMIQTLREGWEIFFFAGHSRTERERGRIYLSDRESLTIEDFKHALKEAIRQGLQVAIFNSCEGLGLAQQLADLHIPAVIVMQEGVPDRVAQAFVREFLGEYAGGRSLSSAVRVARERLEEFAELPGCTGLPLLCQNPATLPPTWVELIAPSPRRERSVKPPSRPKLSTVLLASFVVASLLVGARSLGWFQAAELKAFDRLMQLRPAEAPDERILVVAVTEADIQYQDRMGMTRKGSLADEALMQLLQKLEPHQPQTIGLDIYHDFEFQAQLKAKLVNNTSLVAICKVGEAGKETDGIASPPHIPLQQVGFSDIPSDPDYVIRRQFLGMTSATPCGSDYAFSLQIALNYLEQSGPFSPNRKSEGEVQIGDRVFQKFEHNAGGYQLSPASAQGYQIPINYRAARFQQVSLSELLDGSLDAQLAELARDRIILIGVAQPTKDSHFTPYSRGDWAEKMPGVVVQAHMASQIIAAILDGRSLLWWLPQWAEALWIASWSALGGLLVWFARSPLHQGIAVFASLATLGGLCFVLLLQGGWIPLIPPALALMVASVVATVYSPVSTWFKSQFNEDVEQ